MVGFFGFGFLLWGLVEEAKGVWHLHEISHKTSEETSSSRVKREYNRVEEGRPWLLIASPTGLFIIFLFIWILIMGLGDSKILQKILQDWAGVIGVAGIVFSGFLCWGLVGERERTLKEELESERKRKMQEDYERRCRRWGKYWGMPGFVLLVLDRLKEKEGKEQWKKEEIIKAVIKTLKEKINNLKEELREEFEEEEFYEEEFEEEKFEELYKEELEELDKMECALDKKDEVIPRIEHALNELVIEGLLDLKGEIYSFSFWSSLDGFLSPSNLKDHLEDDLEDAWRDLSGLW
jgi:hypothetical protein